MKKKRLATALLLTLALMLSTAAGCARQVIPSNPDSGENGPGAPDTGKDGMIVDIVYDAEKNILHYVVLNPLDATLYFGAPFHLEKNTGMDSNDPWTPSDLSDELAFDMMLRILEKGQRYEDAVHFELFGKPLEAMAYRIVRDYHSDTDSIRAYLEFQVGEDGIPKDFRSHYTITPKEGDRDLSKDIRYDAEEKTLHFTLVNDGTLPLMFGFYFTVERQNALGGWDPTGLTDDMAFIEMLGIVEPGGTYEDQISFAYFSKPLTAGTYRIFRPLHTDNEEIRFYIQFDVDDTETPSNFNSYAYTLAKEPPMEEPGGKTDASFESGAHAGFRVYSRMNAYSPAYSSIRGLPIHPVFATKFPVDFKIESEHGGWFLEAYDYILPDDLAGESEAPGEEAGGEPGSRGSRVIELDGEAVDADPGSLHWHPLEDGLEGTRIRITAIHGETGEDVATITVVITITEDRIFSIHHLE